MHHPHSAALRALAVLALLAPAAARATTYAITTTADDATVNGNCTLREAIQAARNDVAVDNCPAGGAADVIVLPAGTYPFHGREMFQNPMFGEALEIRSADGVAASNVVVDLGGIDAFLELDNGDHTVTLRRFTIQNGAADFGGALSVDQDPLVVDGMQFLTNVAPTEAGAIYATGARSFEVTNSLFQGNSAGAAAGAVEVFASDPSAPVRLADDQFVGNSVTSTTSFGGGGALVLVADTGGSATCIRSVFSGNSVSSGPGSEALGGAIYLRAAGGGVLRLADAQLLKNSVGGSAGNRVGALAVDADAAGSVQIDRILVTRTGAVPATPVARDVELRTLDTGAVVSLTDAQITSGSGWGISAFATAGRIDLGQLTVAGYANGVAVDVVTGAGTVRLQNSLLAHDQTDLAGDSGLQQSGNCIGISSPNFPGFVDEVDENYRLAPTSTAVDAGVDHQPTQREADLDHHARVVGPHPDCGAYELGGLFTDGFEDGEVVAWPASLGAA